MIKLYVATSVDSSAAKVRRGLHVLSVATSAGPGAVWVLRLKTSQLLEQIPPGENAWEECHVGHGYEIQKNRKGSDKNGGGRPAPCSLSSSRHPS